MASATPSSLEGTWWFGGPRSSHGGSAAILSLTLPAYSARRPSLSRSSRLSLCRRPSLSAGGSAALRRRTGGWDGAGPAPRRCVAGVRYPAEFGVQELLRYFSVRVTVPAAVFFPASRTACSQRVAYRAGYCSPVRAASVAPKCAPGPASGGGACPHVTARWADRIRPARAHGRPGLDGIPGSPGRPLRRPGMPSTCRPGVELPAKGAQLELGRHTDGRIAVHRSRATGRALGAGSPAIFLAPAPGDAASRARAGPSARCVARPRARGRMQAGSV